MRRNPRGPEMTPVWVAPLLLPHPLLENPPPSIYRHKHSLPLCKLLPPPKKEQLFFPAGALGSLARLLPLPLPPACFPWAFPVCADLSCPNLPM